MITNRYYITTIIAIFLSLSLGILIGGTLGQQWINDNQQRIINHYQSKIGTLEQENSSLVKEKLESELSYTKLYEDYRVLFSSSVSNSMVNKRVLWINDTEQKFDSLRSTLEMAGGSIIEMREKTTFYPATNLNENGQSSSDEILKNYDVILFFLNEDKDIEQYEWVLNIPIPVIYVTDDQAESREGVESLTQEIYKQNVNPQSLNEHYRFIQFINQVLQENNQYE